jgi:PTS system nitrogen regulatory IIA component
MDLSGILAEECVQIGTQAADKKSILQEVARLAKKSPVLSDVSEEAILQALNERESLGSTGFGEGIAIPHCVLDGISQFVVGLLVVSDGVNFESLDGDPAKFFVFIIGPSSERNNHIRVLATVSQVLRIPGAKEELLAEKCPVTIRESFLRYSRDEVDTKGHSESCIFHVFVQDEHKFYDVLQVFSMMESCSVSVVEAKDATEFLHKLPLFSNFWSEQRQGFNRIISATVKKSLSNDTIRQINDIAGGLDKQAGIMVTVQDLFYAGGSLNS